ncbi:protein kinase C theta type-like [Xenopus laevis]|uniref:Protein kinase C theta type-like n=1 Tax=Xenopus laevis TaxID=8355 RepID=A0A8J1M302_XENLA|nr:protein kinase C theta type-like [Xenopus laevis]
MVLEYASGGTLQTVIKRQKIMNSQKILFYSSEIAVGLQFLHAKGIVHRDLKPENVFIDKEGHIKIGDFGLACENTPGHKTRYGLYGTPGYIAPEILSEDPYDSGADWWSLGVIVYEMATSKLPFPPERNLRQLLYTIIYEKPRYPKSLQPELRDLLQQLLQKNPDTRLGVYSNIRNHPFFSSIDWVKVERRQLVPPMRPKIRSVAGLSSKNIPFPKEDPRETSVLENFNYVDPSWQE